VLGIDNNMRPIFWARCDTLWQLEMIKEKCPKYEHKPVDIRDRDAVSTIVNQFDPDLIIHCAAQLHMTLLLEFFLDFEVNATGTLNMLSNSTIRS